MVYCGHPLVQHLIYFTNLVFGIVLWESIISCRLIAFRNYRHSYLHCYATNAYCLSWMMFGSLSMLHRSSLVGPDVRCLLQHVRIELLKLWPLQQMIFTS